MTSPTHLASMLSPAISSPSERDVLIARARHGLLEDGATSLHAQVEPWITRSWRRCLANGRKPGERLVFDAVSTAALRHSQEHSHPLLQAARPVLAQLADAIAGMRYFPVLTDAAGVVIDVQGALDRGDPRAHAIGRVGIDLSEAAVGTTAIGAALTELRPVGLHRGEHFFDNNSSYSCAGAPLFDPQGQCMGMLDLTGVDVPERPELRHLVARSAHAVEDAVLRQMPHALLLRLNWPGTTLGGEGDGLLALDADGCVLGGNSTARQLIPQPLRPPNSPLHCSDLMALPWTQLFDAARRHSARRPLELPLWSGLRLHGLAQLPRQSAWHSAGAGSTLSDRAFTAFGAGSSQHPATHARAAPRHGLYAGTLAAPPAPLLREAEAALIRQAVQDARGNVAEAARVLGISRATVYRKLGAPKGRG